MDYFWPISLILEAKKVFPKNMALSYTARHAPCQNSGKPDDPIPRKHVDRPQDGQTLFYRTLPATAGGTTSTVAVEYYLKVKDIEYNVGLTKNYCITVSMKKLISIHKLILKMQQILGSHELNDHAPFSDHAHPKFIQLTVSFPEFAPACKKLVHSIYSFLRYSQF